MIIIKTKDDTYFTDSVDTQDDIFYVFNTTSKKGKIQKHILAKNQVVETIEQEGTVEDSRKPKLDE